MDGALDVSSGQERQGIARVDGERAILRLGPLPLVSFVVADLERCHGLPVGLVCQ